MNTNALQKHQNDKEDLKAQIECMEDLLLASAPATPYYITSPYKSNPGTVSGAQGGS